LCAGVVSSLEDASVEPLRLDMMCRKKQQTKGDERKCLYISHLAI